METGDGDEQDGSAGTSFADDDRTGEETEDALRHIVLERSRRCVDRIVKKEGDPNVHLARLLRDILLELDAMRHQQGREEP